MKSSENLRLIVKIRRLRKAIYRKLESLISPSESSDFCSHAHTRHMAYQNVKSVPATKKMNPLFWTVDDWYFWSQWASAFFVAVAIISGRISNSRQGKEVARLKKETAEAHKATAELQASVAPRRLLKIEQEVISFETRKFIGQAVGIWCAAGDKEADTFAWELASALNLAGWSVFSPASLVDISLSGAPFGSIPKLPTGVTVESTSDNPSVESSKTLVRALAALGFNATLSTKVDPRPNPIVLITVQARPEGAQGSAKIRAANQKTKP